MAVIEPSPVTLPTRLDMDGMCEVVWPALTTSDVGGKVSLARLADRTVQLGGTFGGATISIQGSLVVDPGESDWLTLVDSSGLNLSFTSVGIQSVMQQTLWVRPKVVGGSGTSVDVLLLGRRY
jgi:hypothetical protein